MQHDIFEYLLFNTFGEASKQPVLQEQLGEFELWGAGRNNKYIWIPSIINIYEYLLFEMHQNTEFCTEHWRIWALRCGQNQYYLNIFDLKFLWEGIKTPSFAQNIGESGLSGVGRNNISQYLLFKIPFRRHQNTLFFQRTLENLGFQVWARIILREYILLKMTLGRHQNTQFCTEHWRIWAFRCGQD